MGLITAFTPEPFQKIGIESHGYQRFAARPDNLRVLPEFSVSRARFSIRLNAFTYTCRARAPKFLPIGTALDLLSR